MPTEKLVTVADAAEHIGITADGNLTPRPRADGESNRPSVPSTLAECYLAARQARGGGFLYTQLVSDRLGTAVAAIGMRLGAHPTYLTLANLVLGIGGSAAIMASGYPHRTTYLLAVGVVLWQVAYIFDCADGQLARATGKTSAYGASVDVFVDVAVQISLVAALSDAILLRHEIPGLLVVLFASAWPVNIVTFLLARGDGHVSHSLISRPSALVSVAKLLRDYGFVVLVLGMWLVASPSTLLVPVLTVTATNLMLLVVYVTRAAVLSVRASREPQDAGNRVHAPRDSHAAGLSAGEGPSAQDS